MTESQTKTCQNCKTDFKIEPDDFAFCERIQVPPPTWCPECRNMRRMAWREDRTLYKDICKLCSRDIITIHRPGGPFTVFCRECYNSDKWDPLDYGREYDLKKPFFQQYRELMEAVPRPALTGSNLVNSEYTHASESLKNCYYVFFSYFSENSQNCFGLLLSRNVYDSYAADNSDTSYECLQSNRLYNARFAYFCDECLDCSFIYNCVGCSDCFGCVNLRKKKYCLFNEQLSKEDYFERLKAWDLGNYQKLAEAKKKFRELYLSVPHRYAHVLNSQNVTGDIIRDAKDCLNCFTALDGIQNCKYLYAGGLNIKDSWDVSATGDTAELLYETMMVTGRVSRCFFSAGGSNSRDVWYTDWALNSSDLFGCVSVKNKHYCVLNKQYSREEYEALIAKIRKHMDEMPYTDKKDRIYGFGEFFPAEISAFAYNESFAFPWYPKTKAEVAAEGWEWAEPAERTYKITLRSEDLPGRIQEVTDDITKEIIGCAHRGECNDQCTTAFRINTEELGFYRKLDIALPRLCPNCRNAERFGWRNRFHLWQRRCMCPGGHAHGNDLCPNEFRTTFAPNNPEIIYCDQCYRAEFI